jgi:hypothetical protein
MMIGLVRVLSLFDVAACCATSFAIWRVLFDIYLLMSLVTFI